MYYTVYNLYCLLITMQTEFLQDDEEWSEYVNSAVVHGFVDSEGA